QYANRSLALILGRRLDDLDDVVITDVLMPLEGPVVLDRLMTESADGVMRAQLTVARADGVRRILDVATQARREDDAVVGFQGVVRDVTATHELDVAKNEFLALITHDLRNPLTTILGLGATLETYADELSP